MLSRHSFAWGTRDSLPIAVHKRETPIYTNKISNWRTPIIMRFFLYKMCSRHIIGISINNSRSLFCLERLSKALQEQFAWMLFRIAFIWYMYEDLCLIYTCCCVVGRHVVACTIAVNARKYSHPPTRHRPRNRHFVFKLNWFYAPLNLMFNVLGSLKWILNTTRMRALRTIFDSWIANGSELYFGDIFHSWDYARKERRKSDWKYDFMRSTDVGCWCCRWANILAALHSGIQLSKNLSKANESHVREFNLLPRKEFQSELGMQCVL